MRTNSLLTDVPPGTRRRNGRRRRGGPRPRRGRGGGGRAGRQGRVRGRYRRRRRAGRSGRPRAKRSKMRSRRRDRDTGAVVVDDEPDPAVAAQHADAHGATTMVVGVVEQVGEHAVEPAAVAEHDRWGIGVLDRHFRARSGGFRTCRTRLDQLDLLDGPRPCRPGRHGRSPGDRRPSAGTAAFTVVSRSKARCAVDGMASLRRRSTSLTLTMVVKGERSSWLTSEANRASCRTRCSSAPAVVLKLAASGRRSGSDWSRQLGPRGRRRRRSTRRRSGRSTGAARGG